MKIINKFDRTKLGEGRDFGIGFAFVKKLRNNTFKTIQAFTACKDFLNDIVFSEEHNKNLASIYGFKHKRSGFLEDKYFFFLGINTLDYLNGKDWERRESAEKILCGNTANFLVALNKLERYIGLRSKSTIVYNKNGHIVLRSPIKWAKQPFLISLLTLFIRTFFNVSKDVAEKPLLEMIEAQKSKIFIMADKYLYKSIEKYVKLDQKKVNNIVFPSCAAVVNTVHNSGVVTLFQNIERPNSKLKSKIC